TDVTDLAVHESARRDFVADAGRKTIFLESLVIHDAAAVDDAAVIGRGPPEGAFGAEDEIVGDIGIDANGRAPAPFGLVRTFRVPAADSRVGFGPEAAQGLSIGL